MSRIFNNPAAGRSYIPYQSNIRKLEASANRLATGDRFANASDGAGELSVTDRMKLSIQGTSSVLNGMQNAVGYANTQDAILGKVSDIIVRMKELAAAAVDTTKTAADRSALNSEFRALDDEVADMATNSKYNGTAIFGTDTTIRIGLETTDTISFSQIDLAALTFVVLSLNSTTSASTALSTLDTRAGSLAALRVKSRNQNLRVERSLDIVGTYINELTNSHSAIREVDLAKETGKFTQNQVLLSSSQAVLAQANSLPQQALAFLQF